MTQPNDDPPPRPPAFDAEQLPRHVGLVMDGNGRWAQQRGLSRTEGHRRGEAALFDVVEGCLAVGVKYLSAYAFSTENWRRSPQEVRFLLGYSRNVLRRRRDALHALGVRVLWAGRRERLWRSVARELDAAVELTAHNTAMTLTLCVNYGARAELTDAVRTLVGQVASGQRAASSIDEAAIAAQLYQPALPDVDLFLRTSGEQRLSNFLLWQSAYAELVFVDTLFPDFDRVALWQALQTYVGRARRFGSA
ncbi:MAG: isoprenyl transferase [Mycobacteriales bacterium]